MKMEYDTDDDWIPGYNCFDETRPDSVVYNGVFEVLKSQSHRAVYLLRDSLNASKYQNKITKGLSDEINKLLDEPDAGEAMFLVSGDMGAGKSTTINSIIGLGVVARKGSGGDSCTWVVQRFMKKWPGQESPFAAKVYFYSPEEVRNIIEALFETYYTASKAYEKSQRKPADYTEDEDVELVDTDNYNQMQTALDAFRALFGQEDDFADDEKIKEFLAVAKSEKDRSITEELTGMANDILSSFKAGEDAVTIGAHTASRLISELQPFTYQLRGEIQVQSNPWPLVKVIDFGLNVPLLNDGHILVHVPGLSDTNTTRAKSAKMYRRQCTHMITVASVKRALAGKTLKESLRESYQNFGSGGTMLVLTHGDEIDEDTEATGGQYEKKQSDQLAGQLKDLALRRRELSQKERKATAEDRMGY